jgi:16S rRNA (cytidine1402-2'-O)-methyltransferase
MSETPAGILFLVATPIGNLEDISLRAIRVLREADLIAAEDTRHTAKLLHHYDIRRPTTSLHEHNEQEKARALVGRLLGGARVALVTDAGTPAVLDPGYRLVRTAIDAGIRGRDSGPAPCWRRAVSSSPTGKLRIRRVLPRRRGRGSSH